MIKKVFLTLVAISTLSFSACERAKQVITPNNVSMDSDAPVKIGVIQP